MHDIERAVMIYQHETRGANKAITDMIDAHLTDEQLGADGEDEVSGVTVHRELMARQPYSDR